MKRVRFGDLRQCSLPPETADEPDMLRALRMNVNSKHPDRLRVVIPDSMFDYIQQNPLPAAEPDETPESD